MSKANPNSIINRREAIASVAALTAVPVGLGLASSNPAASACIADPIFMLIEEHKAARAEFSAASLAEHEMHTGALFRKSPRVQLGFTPETVITMDGVTTVIPSRPYNANERADINKYITDKITSLAPGDADGLRALNKRRDELLADWDRQEEEAVNPEWEAAKGRASEAADAEQEASVALLTTAPTTLAGAVALLNHIQEHHSDDYLATDCGEDGHGYDALVSSLIATLAPMVRQ